MKKIYLLVSVFTIIFISCDTDFDVNAEWEEVTVVYGLLDAGDDNKTQQIKISKAFLGKMDALQMAQYADSINFDKGSLILITPPNLIQYEFRIFIYFPDVLSSADRFDTTKWILPIDRGEIPSSYRRNQ